jgi:hypothetical protein
MLGNFNCVRNDGIGGNASENDGRHESDEMKFDHSEASTGRDAEKRTRIKMI